MICSGRFVMAALLAFGLSACATGPCRQLRQPEMAATQNTATAEGENPPADASFAAPAIAREAAASSGTKMSKTQANNAKKTVFVYKADGSRQCEPGTGVSADAMEKSELQGIKILSRDKRNDGLMHIQMCGSPTGMINVYEIPANMQKEAESRGFKKLEKKS